jgi:hypothetical protein
MRKLSAGTAGALVGSSTDPSIASRRWLKRLSPRSIVAVACLISAQVVEASEVGHVLYSYHRVAARRDDLLSSCATQQ